MTTTLQIDIAQSTKLRAERIALEIGRPLNKLVGDYIKSVANNAVEFPARAMGKKMERIVGQVEKDIKTGKNIVGPFKGMGEAISYLDYM